MAKPRPSHHGERRVWHNPNNNLTFDAGSKAMRAKAVICRELNRPVVVEDIEVDGTQAGEVLVKLAACAGLETGRNARGVIAF